jgi:hypothetical protein
MLVIDDLSVRVAGSLLIDQASARIPAGARVRRYGINSAALWLEYLIVRYPHTVIIVGHDSCLLDNEWILPGLT